MGFRMCPKGGPFGKTPKFQIPLFAGQPALEHAYAYITHFDKLVRAWLPFSEAQLICRSPKAQSC